QDHAADVVTGTRGGEQHLAVRAATILGAVATNRVEALLDGAARLVGGQDPLARRHDCPGHVLQAHGFLQGRTANWSSLPHAAKRAPTMARCPTASQHRGSEWDNERTIRPG